MTTRHHHHQVDDHAVSPPPPPRPHVNDDNDDTPPSCPYVNDDNETCPGHTTIAAQRPHPRPQWATSRNNNNECVQRDDTTLHNEDDECVQHDDTTSRNDNDERIWCDDAPLPSLLPSASVSSSRATLCDDNDTLSPSLPSRPHPYSYPSIPCILLVTNIYLFL